MPLRKISIDISSDNLSSAIADKLRQIGCGLLLKGEEIAIVEFKKQWPPSGDGSIPLELTLRKIKEVTHLDHG